MNPEAKTSILISLGVSSVWITNPAATFAAAESRRTWKSKKIQKTTS